MFHCGFQFFQETHLKVRLTYGKKYVTACRAKKINNIIELTLSPVSQGAWWRKQMETSSALLALCVGNSPVTNEYPSQRQVTRSVGVFFHLRLNKRLSKQSKRRLLELPSHPLWRHRNGLGCWQISTCTIMKLYYSARLLPEIQQEYDRAILPTTLSQNWMSGKYFP